MHTSTALFIHSSINSHVHIPAHFIFKRGKDGSWDQMRLLAHLLSCSFLRISSSSEAKMEVGIRCANSLTYYLAHFCSFLLISSSCEAKTEVRIRCALKAEIFSPRLRTERWKVFERMKKNTTIEKNGKKWRKNYNWEQNHNWEKMAENRKDTLQLDKMVETRWWNWGKVDKDFQCANKTMQS